MENQNFVIFSFFIFLSLFFFMREENKISEMNDKKCNFARATITYIENETSRWSSETIQNSQITSTPSKLWT